MDELMFLKLWDLMIRATWTAVTRMLAAVFFKAS